MRERGRGGRGERVLQFGAVVVNTRSRGGLLRTAADRKREVDCLWSVHHPEKKVKTKDDVARMTSCDRYFQKFKFYYL